MIPVSDLIKNYSFDIEKHIGPSPKFDPHFHSEVEIYYLCKGKILYLIDSKTITLEEGDLIIIPPNILHKTIATKDDMRERIRIYIDHTFIQKYVGKDLFDMSSPTFYHIEHKNHIIQTLELVSKEFHGFQNDLLINCLLCEFFLFLSRKDPITISLIDQDKLSVSLSNILHYIKENYKSRITLSSVAEKFFMNPSYLSRAFKENTGINFVEYLNNYRVVKAIEMMMKTNKSITEIASENGFNSSNNFCKIFKSIMKTSPLQYKKHHKREP